jgi:hypothetical protein
VLLGRAAVEEQPAAAAVRVPKGLDGGGFDLDGLCGLGHATLTE